MPAPQDFPSADRPLQEQVVCCLCRQLELLSLAEFTDAELEANGYSLEKLKQVWADLVGLQAMAENVGLRLAPVDC